MDCQWMGSKGRRRRYISIAVDTKDNNAMSQIAHVRGPQYFFLLEGNKLLASTYEAKEKYRRYMHVLMTVYIWHKEETFLEFAHDATNVRAVIIALSLKVVYMGHHRYLGAKHPLIR
ncbi:hypothetical protein ACJX0J_012321 [Zea mays]